MLMRGVSGVVDRIMSIPNNAQEVISGLRSREIPEDRLSKPVAQYDVDMFEISHDFGESEVGYRALEVPVALLHNAWVGDCRL